MKIISSSRNVLCYVCWVKLISAEHLKLLATREATNEPHCGPEAQVQQLGPSAELRAEGDTGAVSKLVSSKIF